MNYKMNILIVEDELIASMYLESILNEMNFKNIFKVDCSQMALEIILSYKIDLVFMDLDIKGSIDGIKTANLLNEEYPIPIIFVTGETSLDVIIDTLNTNIFGYIIKPFEKFRFLAPFKIALKKIEEKKFENTKDLLKSEENGILDLSYGCKFNINKNTCYLNNLPINLTKRELSLLKIMALNINSNLSYERIKDNIWNKEDIADSTLRDLISKLKKKLPELLIDNVSGVGYILKSYYN